MSAVVFRFHYTNKEVHFWFIFAGARMSIRSRWVMVMMSVLIVDHELIERNRDGIVRRDTKNPHNEWIVKAGEL